MNSSRRRVVVTGIGTINACGLGSGVLWQAALEGRSAIRELTHFSSNGSPVRVGGEVPNFRPEDFIPTRKSLKVMSRDIRLAVAASILAVRDAHLEPGSFDPTRAGVTLGSGLINNELEEVGAGIKAGFDADGKFQMKLFGREGIRALFPLWLLKYLPNMPACHLSIVHGLRGPSNTLTTSSTGCLQAVGEASRVIERGDADLMLAGACDSKLNPLGLARLHLLGILSGQNQEPGEVYRPFDRRRDGMVIGEGAGLFVLEERRHALRRGARIYGEIAGFAAHVGSPERTMRNALEDSAREPGEIGFIHANGSGVPREDVEEAHSIARVFVNGAGRVPVTASKSLTGHLVDAVGTSELTLSFLSLREKTLSAITNLDEPDPACPLNFVRSSQEIKKPSFLVNALGLGGQSASLVVVNHE